MNINQRITIEDKKRVDSAMELVIKRVSIINIVLQTILFIITAVAFIHCMLDLFNIVWVTILIVFDTLLNHSRYIWKRQRSCIYTKNLDRALSVNNASYYDIKIDNDGVIVNDKYSFRWNSIYAAVYTNEFIILSDKNKVAVMIKADDELKKQIGGILNRNKVLVYQFVKTPVNEEVSKYTVSLVMHRCIKRLIILMIIVIIPFICLMFTKNEVKDLTRDSNQFVSAQFENEYHYITNGIQEDIVIDI